MARGVGAATRGAGCVMSGKEAAYKTGGVVYKPPKFKDGGTVASPRAGAQGEAKRGFKKGGAVKVKHAAPMDADDNPNDSNDSTTAMKKGGRVKKAMGGMIATPTSSAGAGMPAIGALQNQGAIIGAKKKKKSTRLGMLSAPSKPKASPTGMAMPALGPGNALPPQG